ncbi:MAG: sulfoxide reductase heme-binding subunit YedZ [Chloroflexi bacterium]|nr:sulfoxide reductase heme-binding subunit YedZ [Chloroflexota bacterium]
MKEWISQNISKPWKKNKRKLASMIHPLVHVGALIPLVVGLWDFWQGNLGANPIQEITHRTGKTAIILLILSLAISPLKQILNWAQLNKLRRPLGLYAGFYALIHFSIYIVLDYGFYWKAILANSLTNWFVWFGFTTGIILLALTITSLNVVLKKMGKSWKKLHRLVYAAGVLAAVHFILAVKPGVLRPWPFVIIMLILLIYRIPVVQTWVKKIT